MSHRILLFWVESEYTDTQSLNPTRPDQRQSERRYKYPDDSYYLTGPGRGTERVEASSDWVVQEYLFRLRILVCTGICVRVKFVDEPWVDDCKVTVQSLRLTPSSKMEKSRPHLFGIGWGSVP